MSSPVAIPLLRRLEPRTLLLLDLIAAIGYGMSAWALFAHKIDSALVAIVGAVAVSAAFVLVRPQPMLALVSALAGFWLSPFGVLLAFVALVPAGVCLYVVSVRQPRRVRFAALALALSGAAATGLGGHGGGGVVVFALILLTTWTIGVAAGQSHRYRNDVLRHQQQLADARLDRARRGLVDERMRIARELHDVLAHSISVMTVQAAYGNVVIDTEPVHARESLGTIESIGRDTLTEIRRLLDVLREDGSESAQPLTPAPGLDDLPQLIAQTARAGVRSELSVTGNPRPLPAGLDLTVFRLVQEALTNVVKHARTSTAQVRIDCQDAGIVVEVINDGPLAADPPGAGAGHGILGMRERVDLYCGTFSAGPLPRGGFRVRATLPIDDASRTRLLGVAAGP